MRNETRIYTCQQRFLRETELFFFFSLSLSFANLFLCCSAVCFFIWQNTREKKCDSFEKKKKLALKGEWSSSYHATTFVFFEFCMYLSLTKWIGKHSFKGNNTKTAEKIELIDSFIGTLLIVVVIVELKGKETKYRRCSEIGKRMRKKKWSLVTVRFFNSTLTGRSCCRCKRYNPRPTPV